MSEHEHDVPWAPGPRGEETPRDSGKRKGAPEPGEGAGSSGNDNIDLQRETEEKARQPETKLGAIAQTRHTARLCNAKRSRTRHPKPTHGARDRPKQPQPRTGQDRATTIYVQVRISGISLLMFSQLCGFHSSTFRGQACAALCTVAVDTAKWGQARNLHSPNMKNDIVESVEVSGLQAMFRGNCPCSRCRGGRVHHVQHHVQHNSSMASRSTTMPGKYWFTGLDSIHHHLILACRTCGACATSTTV
jgi:hypothetical protein